MLGNNSKRLDRPIPILIGPDYEHVMARGAIVQEPGKTSITIVVEGENSDILGDYLTATEPLAISFVAIPIMTHDTHIEEK